MTATLQLGLYRRGLKDQRLKTTSVNHAINTLKLFYGWLRWSNGFPAGQPLPTDAIALEGVLDLLGGFL